MLKTAFVIRHVDFEDLGAYGAVLSRAGYDIRLVDIGIDELAEADALASDLLVVLGGPLNVEDRLDYPFLGAIERILVKRLDRGRPTFGICLGAQAIAAALGASVRSMGYREIGFAPLELTAEGLDSPLKHLVGVPILHWHGQMFDIPEGAVRLASTPACANQAFALGRNILGIQFHAEVDPRAGFERRLIGHAVEMGVGGASAASLRAAAGRIKACHVAASQAMFGDWLANIDTRAQ